MLLDFENEVNNGGFAQYFENGYGEFAPRIIRLLQMYPNTPAHHIGVLLNRAKRIYAEYEQDGHYDYMTDKMSELDDSFYEYDSQEITDSFAQLLLDVYLGNVQ